MCRFGFGNARVPPMINAPGIGEYLCFTNLLKSHGATYRLYQSKFAEKQRGRIGLPCNVNYVFSDNPDVSNRGMDFEVDFF